MSINITQNGNNLLTFDFNETKNTTSLKNMDRNYFSHNYIYKKIDKNLKINWNKNNLISINNFNIFNKWSKYTNIYSNVLKFNYKKLENNDFKLCECDGSKNRKKVCLEFRIILNLIDNNITEKLIMEKYNNIKQFKIKNTNLILKDIPRTFGNESYFKNDQLKLDLENLLKYFSMKNDNFYVQGMNFIAGSLILHMDPEFVIIYLDFIFNKLNLKDLYCTELKGLKIHFDIVLKLLKKLNIKLYNLFNDNNIFPEYFLTEWLITLGTYKIPTKFHKYIFYGIFKYKWTFIYSLWIEFYNIFLSYFNKLDKYDLLSKIKNIHKSLENVEIKNNIFDYSLLIKNSYSKTQIFKIDKILQELDIN